jgi:hypothetical protein
MTLPQQRAGYAVSGRHRATSLAPEQAPDLLVDQIAGRDEHNRPAALRELAALADERPELRSATVGAVCGFLRSPWPAAERPGERTAEPELRRTAVQLLVDHLRDPSAPTSWVGSDLDLAGAVLDGGVLSFTGAVLDGGTLAFTEATLCGATLDLSGITVNSGTLSLADTRLLSGRLLLVDARLLGGLTAIRHATVAPGVLAMAGTTGEPGVLDVLGSSGVGDLLVRS